MSWERETLDKVLTKYRATAPLARKLDSLPYIGGAAGWLEPLVEGRGWWTNGFWPALMWLSYSVSKDRFFLQEARRAQAVIVPEMHAYYGTSHDLGFMYLISCGADYKLTNDSDALRETLLAANLLAGRFNPAGFIRAWNGRGREGWMIVDCMMNLPLLYSASALTGDPRYAAIARVHADTTDLHAVREDGSCHHIVCFDPYTGRVLSTPAGQGCAEGSSWSRGQAWAMYGFVLSYLHTGDRHYLYTACRIADHFISRIRGDGLTSCDFRQPAEEDLVDNIAGACAACGLIELSHASNDSRYMDAALKLLHGIDRYSADYDPSTCGILTRCTAAYSNNGPDREGRIIYGDYFYLEALCKLNALDPMLWKLG